MSAARFISNDDYFSKRSGLAREVIEKVGPGGHFLQEAHTFKHFRNELWVPSLLTREPREVWRQQGSKDLHQRLREKVAGIIATHQVPSLPDRTVAELARLRKEGVKLY